MSVTHTTALPRRSVTARGLGLAAVRRSPLLVIAALVVYLALASPVVLSSGNINASLVQAAPIAIVAFALTIVVMGGGDDAVSGGIDLSIPGSAALGTVIISELLTAHQFSLPLAFLVALLATLAVGGVNAFLVSYVKLPPILATLASYVSVVGIVRMIGQNRRINVDDPAVVFIRDSTLLGIPLPVVLMLLVGALCFWGVHRTRWGIHLQAAGGSRDTAVASGLNVARLVASSYVIASAIAAIAAVGLVARGSGSSPGIDERLLVDMVLATFIGAAFSRRNVVSIYGALFGAVLVSFLSNSLILNRVPNSWIDGTKGILILLVVATAALSNRGRK